ncbi:hypothetical protein OG884_15645 [Streptosporangium sp. NBC_01755]|uniref:zinc finger domain-containing protein n=1 Tax=Streptosporangium sp. NBC_01755 TaxID=2975949 RepID=UPI002DD9D58E|nr:hypothetical protein [Streptosporangium sp. NBC_01755]WSD03267.1 hypothetical protein OG884_15645 [Streptosporangium sp. NBC_01755]
MTPVEAAVLTRRLIRLWPQQRIEDGTPDEWYVAALHAVDYQDADNALNNLVGVNTFVSLAEILAEVRRIRESRIARHPMPAPPAELTDNPGAYRDRVIQSTKQLADGLDVGRVLALGSGRPPTDEYNWARGLDRHPLRIAAKKVRCPWCKAGIGSACTTAAGRRLDQPAHDERLVAADLADWDDVGNSVRRVVLRQADLP